MEMENQQKKQPCAYGHSPIEWQCIIPIAGEEAHGINESHERIYCSVHHEPEPCPYHVN